MFKGLWHDTLNFSARFIISMACGRPVVVDTMSTITEVRTNKASKKPKIRIARDFFVHKVT
jgi:hypothetical protein